MTKKLSTLNITKLWGVTLLIYLSFTSQNFAQKYEFETAVIYKSSKQVMIDVMIIEVSEEIYIIGAGFKEAHYITEKRNNLMTNQIEEIRSISITDGELVTTYDPDTNEGTRMKIPFSDTIGKMSEEDMKKFANQMGDATGTETRDIGTKEIAGKTCKGTEATTNMMGMETKSTIWQYGNFTMEMVSEGAGTSISERVTKFDESIKVDPKLFLVPDDVVITEIKSPF